MSRRIVRVAQHGSSDCGVACLASVAAYYGLKVPLAKIHHLAATDRTGTNALGLTQAAGKLGFLAKGVRGTMEALQEVGKPVIAHVVIRDQHHYVVVYETTRKHVVYMDPDGGKVHRLPPDEFAKIWDGVLVILAPGEHFKPGNETVPPLRRIWQLVHPHRWVMAQALFGAALYTVLGLSTAIYVQKIVDHVFPSANQNLLNLLSVTMLVLLGVQVFIGASQELLMLGVARRIDGRLMLGYYDHILRLPLRFFTARPVGDIVARVNDAARIRNLVSTISLQMALNGFVLVFSVVLMFLYSWRLALLLSATLPLYALVYVAADVVNRRNQRAMLESAADLQSWMVESVEGIATVKHLRLEEFASIQAEIRLVRLLRTFDRSTRTAVAAGSAADLLSRLAVVTAFWVGGTMVLNQRITPGELLSLYAVVAYLTGPVSALIGMNRDLRDAQIAADRLFEIMDLSHEEPTGGQFALLPRGHADIVFEDVSFRYGAGAPIFRNLSMRIPAGTMTAIVGGSGSGKSTLVSLIHKCEPLNGGCIRIGRADLAYLSTDDLRRRIGVVPQKVELFSGSILNNIAVGDLEPDLLRVMQIAESLGIDEFVEKLPYGYHSLVGENGTTLSGGQRQRIAIARALYLDPEILVLDEATSSLDTTSERKIQRALDAFRGNGKTIVVIAHRLSTVVHADKIVVLSDGAVAEEGTHQELLARQGAYHQLWTEQFPPGDLLAVASDHGARHEGLEFEPPPSDGRMV
jgi:ATP-binding cassette subfamily B protein